ncbi:MAG: hypothetical protein A2Y16_03295 [Tenericutes bacterium GWF2_57_13]|nr:MAG: hypothetical protein A2Y16_03295 [Tenericutes bacterium GWF2_57_13]
MRTKHFEALLRTHYRTQVPASLPIDLSDAVSDAVTLPVRTRPIASFLGRSALKLAVGALFAVFTVVIALGRGPATTVVLAQIEDVYAFQAVSATDLLIQATPKAAPLAFLPLATGPRVETELDVLNNYLNMMEGFLGNTNRLAAVVVASDRVGFQYRLVYDTVDLFGAPVTYSLYYNETSATGVSFVFDDEDDDHAVTSLTGEMTIGATIYRLEGKKIQDGDEEAFVWRSYVDLENYVLVRYETDDDGEKKFFYSVVTGGILTNRSKLKVEAEDGKIVTELTFIEGAASGRYVFREVTVEGIRYVDVSYVIDDGTHVESGTVRVSAVADALTGLTSYAYVVKTDDDDEESHYEYDRHDDDEDEEDEDEFDEEDKEENEENEENEEENEEDEEESNQEDAVDEEDTEEDDSEEDDEDSETFSD